MEEGSFLDSPWVGFIMAARFAATKESNLSL
jgi:hypothetical protein